MTSLKTFIILLAVSIFASFLAQPVLAVSTPSFPDCSNPQGTTKASYSEGTHGIVGDTNTYTGSDAVYTLTDDTLVQCFCSTDGNGIQSDWWKVSSLTDAQLQELKNDGWIYVPDGSLWGLTNDPYMVKNNNYSCRGGGTGGGTGGGEILAEAATTTNTSGDILGLASTGNIALLYGVTTLGVASLLVALILRHNAKK